VRRNGIGKKAFPQRFLESGLILVIFAAALLLRMLRSDRVVVLVSCRFFFWGSLQFSTVTSLRKNIMPATSGGMLTEPFPDAL
jgi:predicted membrane metal-binding protein